MQNVRQYRLEVGWNGFFARGWHPEVGFCKNT